MNPSDSLAQVEKTPPATPARTSKLAIASLIFGVLGFFCLPFVGALAGVILGHLALREIRRSPGHLAGRGLGKAGLILGYAWFAVLMAVVALLAFLIATHRLPLGYRALAPGMVHGHRPNDGVKMANELSADEVANLKQMLSESPDAAGEEIICCYKQDDRSDNTEAETAILTTKRIAFRKGERPSVFALVEIESVMDSDAYRAKYTSNQYDLTRYRIEIKRQSGVLMRITIVPYNDGAIFFHALQDAWIKAKEKNATTTPR